MTTRLHHRRSVVCAAFASAALTLAFGPGQCNTLYPASMAPSLVAGAPLASDGIKCH